MERQGLGNPTSKPPINGFRGNASSKPLPIATWMPAEGGNKPKAGTSQGPWHQTRAHSAEDQLAIVESLRKTEEAMRQLKIEEKMDYERFIREYGIDESKGYNLRRPHRRLRYRIQF